MTDFADDAQALEEAEREAAIRRLTAATPTPRRYAEGRCNGCGDEIEPERLAVNPTAARCLQCQEAVERGGRLFRKPA